jgi:hypothetical protein
MLQFVYGQWSSVVLLNSTNQQKVLRLLLIEVRLNDQGAFMDFWGILCHNFVVFFILLLAERQP